MSELPVITVAEYSWFSSERTLQSRSRLSYPPARGIPKHNLQSRACSYVPDHISAERQYLPDGVYLVLDLRHGASTLDKILDGCKIVTFAMFEALAVMKDKILVVRRDYFGVDV